jgi:inner membrane protein
VGDSVALALTIGASLWVAITWAAPVSRRVLMGLALWTGLEVMFFAASAVGRRAVAAAVGSSLHDVVLTPSVGNPLCLSVLALTAADGTYGVASAMVAPFPGIRRANDCRGAPRALANGTPSGRADSRSIRWGALWTGEVSELRELARTNCEVAAALQFIRVPVWRHLANGEIELSDIRFGAAGGGFASIVAARAPAPCPRYLPGWDWPRLDLLSPSP